MKEELGVDGQAGEFIGHYPFPEMNQIILAFALKGAGELRLGREIAEIRLLSRREIESHEFGRLALTARIVGDWLAKARGG